MSDEDFLKRWSRRKQEAAQAVPSRVPRTAAAEPRTSSPADDASARPQAGPAKATDEFDLASLPSLESITATTDVAAFLRSGVPLELSRAALRRAWVSDPAIRDFVGPAENAWDFTDPNAMPGFGPLDQTPEQVRELAAKIVNRVRDAAEELASGEEKPPSQNITQRSAEPAFVQAHNLQFTAPVAPTAEADTATINTGSPDDLAPQKNTAPQQEMPRLSVRRTHGSALPR